MHLPSVLPRELIYSRLIRYITINGIQESQFLEQTFGNRRFSLHPFLTAGIRNISKVSGEDISSIFLKQTLGPLFSYFLPQHSKKIYSAFLSNNPTQAIRTCQLVSFKGSELLTLKFCPLCAKNDIENFGVSYWHREHQIPGIESCSVHQVWLVHEHLPERSHLRTGLLPQLDVKAKKCPKVSHKLAMYAEKVLNNIDSLNTSFNLKKLKIQLNKNGYLTDSQRCRRKQTLQDFYGFVKKLQYPSKNLLPNSNTDFKYLSYLLKPIEIS